MPHTLMTDGNAPVPSPHGLPRVDDGEAGRQERRNVARGHREAARVRNGGDVAAWCGEALAGGTGVNGQVGVVPGCVGVEGQHAIPEQLQ